MERLIDGPSDAPNSLILAHGAGAGMDSAFMAFAAQALGDAGCRVIRFEFPYMERRRETGRRGPPDRMPALQEAFVREFERESSAGRRLFVGGKSMGGRVASMLSDALGADGLVCFGYPFHPAGRPDRLRVAHLSDLKTPALVVQGTRDALGSREEVQGYDLAETIELHWLEDGDHSFKPRKKSGFTESGHWLEATQVAARFIGA